MIIRHCQLKIPHNVFAQRNTAAQPWSFDLVCYVPWGVVCVTSTFDGNISVVIYVQCECDAVSCSAVAQFVSGWECCDLSPLVWLFSPPSPGSQGLTTRCSENRAVAVPSFKVPSDRLQSFLYRHQYGEHDLNNGCFFFWLFSDSVLRSFLSRVWSIMERVMV